MNNYATILYDDLVFKSVSKSPYLEIMDREPPEWCLMDAEVMEEDENGKPFKKPIKIMRLPSLYYLLDTLYSSYDISITEVKLIGKAVMVSVRLVAITLDGLTVCRDGSGMVDCSLGLRGASAKAEALAIKNAAKKLGRIFGRDMYAENIKPKVETSREEDVEIVISLSSADEGINPVYTDIIELLKGCDDPEVLKNIGQNIMDKAADGDLDADEFDHLTGIINQKIKQFNSGKNVTGKKKANTNRRKNPVSGALHGGATNGTTIKSGQRRGATGGNGKNKA